MGATENAGLDDARRLKSDYGFCRTGNRGTKNAILKNAIVATIESRNALMCVSFICVSIAFYDQFSYA